MRELGPGNHAVMVLNAGPADAPENPLGENFVMGSVPERFSIAQGGLVVNARDMAVERRGAGRAEGLPAGEWSILRIDAAAGSTPPRPGRSPRNRARARPDPLGEDRPRVFRGDEAAGRSVRARRGSGRPRLDGIVAARIPALSGIGAMLALLVPVLALQKRLVADARRFPAFRLAFLAVTVFLRRLCRAGAALDRHPDGAGAGRMPYARFRLPPLRSAFARAVGLRAREPRRLGQGHVLRLPVPVRRHAELVAWVAKPLRIRQVHVPPGLDRPLRKLKYVVLAGLLGATALGWPAADAVAEVEPFKTAITLSFVRSWPFVAYAVGLLALNLFVYKGFCRYLCPLGAGLAVAGRLRILDWIPRGPNAERPASSARCAAATAPSRRVGDRLPRVLPVHGLRDDHPRSGPVRAAGGGPPACEADRAASGGGPMSARLTRRRAVLGACGLAAAGLGGFRALAAARGSRPGAGRARLRHHRLADRRRAGSGGVGGGSVRGDGGHARGRAPSEPVPPRQRPVAAQPGRAARRPARPSRHDARVRPRPRLADRRRLRSHGPPLWPLWSQAAARGGRPAPETLTHALGRIGWRRVHLSPEAVRLEAGTEITLNAVVQGYAADVVMAALGARGIADAFVDTGDSGPPGRIRTARPGGSGSPIRAGRARSRR